MNCRLYLNDSGLNWTDGQLVSDFQIEQSERMQRKNEYAPLRLNFNALDAGRSRAEFPIIVKVVTPQGDSDVKRPGMDPEMMVLSVLKLPPVSRIVCGNAVTAIVYLHEVQAALRRSRLKKALLQAKAPLAHDLAALTMPLLHDFLKSYGGSVGCVYYDASEEAALAPMVQTLEELMERPLDRVRLDAGLDVTPEAFIVQTDGPLTALYLTLAVSSPAATLRLIAAAQADSHSRVLSVSLFK